MRILNQGMLFLLLIVVLTISSCNNDDTNPDSKDYRQEMRGFVQDISSYAKGINPDFLIIPQNGVEIVSITNDNEGLPDMTYINSIDGIGQEDLFYGCDADDQATPAEENEWLRGFLDIAKNTGSVKILVTDYCHTPSKMDDSYSKNSSHGYISFAADHRELDNISTYPAHIYNENSDVITSLQDAKNFLYMISPDNEFSTKQEFVDGVKGTNYDLLIMDLFFDGDEFTPAQIEELKQKDNGGKRLLICYMSIGEAEDYRYYWQSDWTIGNPSFIVKENPDWEGNYKVKYWEPEWQNIIFGNDNSYLKKIVDSGFDGVYLDIIDAYEFFE